MDYSITIITYKKNSYMEYNNLIGSIPSEIGNLSKLNKL